MFTASARSAPRATVGAVWRALRPVEWIKNVFVLAPLVFAGRFDDSSAVTASAVTFAAFCAVASAGYLVNDVLDVETDRRHPIKRTRPIAMGQLSIRTAGVVALALYVLGLGLGLLVEPSVAGATAGYALLGAAYSLALKKLVILDVMTVAGLFLLRVLAGGLATDIHVSDWLLVCTGMLALFLGFTKRRQEATSELHAGEGSRPVLEHYSLGFLDQMVSLVTTGTVISYVVYAIDSPLVGGRMVATAPAVLYGVFRYLYLVYHRNDPRDAATLVTRDPGMLLGSAAWLLTVVLLIYL